MSHVPIEQMWRWVESDAGYGRCIWLGPRVRISSRKALTPMRPHVYRSGDEHCNDVLSFHLWPLGGIDIWWRRKRRTAADGMCNECIAFFREATP